jgi:hypothetical protein
MNFIHRALPYAFAIAPLGHLNNYHTTFYKNYEINFNTAFVNLNQLS